MGWGDTYRQAHADASPARQDRAQQSLSGVQAAGQAVARCAAALGQAAGEVVNTAAGAAVFAAMSMFGAVKRLFTDPPAPVLACPQKQGVDITTNAYRKSLVNSAFAGADDPRLGAAMQALGGPQPPSLADARPHLETIAELRQRPLAEIEQDYEAYRQLREDQEDRIAHSGGRLEPIDQLKDEQAGFMGSTWQLRYGKVAGDHLGVDPVFGAMLNPTGGLVGPGNEGKAPDSWYMPEAVAYHGAYHDAMGYLYNYQNAGPGYNYMGSPIGLSTDNPLAGQATGIAQWSANLAL